MKVWIQSIAVVVAILLISCGPPWFIQWRKDVAQRKRIRAGKGIE